MLACPNKPKRQRRGRGDAAVGPAHSRGVTGVTPGEPYTRWWMALEGAGSQSIRAEKLRAILRCGEPGNNDIALVSRRARVNGDTTGCSVRRLPVCYLREIIIFCRCRQLRLAEEPCAGNPQARFCEGRKALLQGRILWHSSIEREEKRRIQSMPK